MYDNHNPNKDIPHITKYIVGKTPSIIQYNNGKTTTPGVSIIAAKMPRILPHQSIKAPNQNNQRTRPETPPII
jgi:hypothetical protein|tara:strand:+ start:1622 stop:1840 length:219 start_codon:yes stop_codon:yes gene_type:complete